MWKAALASAFALVTMGMSFALADGASETLVSREAVALAKKESGSSAASVGTSPAAMSRIAQFKAALRLTPEQARHWPAVEAALRDMIRRAETEEVRVGGVLQRIGTQATSAVLTAGALKRLVAAAQPLIKSLDSEQKRDALHLARVMGFGQVASRFE